MTFNINHKAKRALLVLRKYFAAFAVGAFLFLATLIVLWPHVHISIPVGYYGVIFRPLFGGTDLDKVLAEGFWLKFPWDKVTLYDTQIQRREVTVDVLTSDLLKSKLTVSYQFRVYDSSVPMLHKFVGPDYIEKFVTPSVIASVRTSIGRLSSGDAFTKNIAAVQEQIRIGSDLSIINNVAPPGLDEVRLVRIVGIEFQKFSFPDAVEEAIENKLVEAAKAQGYEYILSAARSEAERKQIEAEGIRKFQDIVRPGLSDNYLRWRGIEATQNLANSSNSKIIVFGQGPTGLPLIMGEMDKSPVSPKPKQ